VTESGPKLTTILLSTHLLKTVEFVMTCQNLKQNRHLNSAFSEYMDPLFEKICDRTNEYARVQLNNPNRKKLKDDEKWFDTTVQATICISKFM
jgi:hypothetical protein